MALKTTGSDLPSTLGGVGWRPRAGSHADDVAAGRLWARCGYRSEFAPLRAVLLARPPDSLGAVEHAPGHLMLDRVDLGAMREQTQAVAETYRCHGVEVHLARPPASAPPNVVFMRDLFFMTPAGAVLARTASAQRAGEERYAAEALAAAGFPILRTVTGTATFEGADALWLDAGTVVVGVGFRTNDGGAEALRGVLRDQGVGMVAVPLGPGVQHLLGAVVFLDERLAAVQARAANAELRGLLRARDVELIELAPDAHPVSGRGMNLVPLAPRRVVMPAGAPAVRDRLEAAGVEAYEVDVGEYLKAAGGVGCLTGILRRE